MPETDGKGRRLAAIQRPAVPHPHKARCAEAHEQESSDSPTDGQNAVH